MSELVAGALREPSSRPAQIPADELANQARPVVPYSSGGWRQVVPEIPFKPDASDLIGQLVRHDPGLYGLYVHCRYIDALSLGRAHRQIHGCIVCPLYVRFNSLSSTKPRDTQILRTSQTDTPIQEIA